MKEKTIEYQKVNIIALPIVLIVTIITGILYALIISDAKKIIDELNLVLVMIVFFLLILVHEFIHGLFIAICAKGRFKSVKLGMNWKALMPYCHSKEGLSVKAYRIVAIMPTIILGIIPMIIGFWTVHINLIAVSFFMIMGGAGDYIVLWMLKDFKKNTFVYDHPSKMGFLYKDDLNSIQ